MLAKRASPTRRAGPPPYKHPLSWLRAARLHTMELEAADNNDTGRLSFVISRSPSFRSGITSASFQADGNAEVNKEWFGISVRIGRMAGRASFLNHSH